MVKETPMFDINVHPVHIGVYKLIFEREFTPQWSLWDGEKFVGSWNEAMWAAIKVSRGYSAWDDTKPHCVGLASEAIGWVGLLEPQQ